MADQSTYPYIIVIRNEHSRAMNAIGFLLCFVSLLFFLKEQISSQRLVFTYCIGIGVIAFVLIRNSIISRQRDKQVYYSKGLLIAALVWTNMPYFQWLLFVFAALALIEYQARHPLEIGFSYDHIVFNSLLKKKYSWSDVNHVVLKDGLLTVDFRNNKIFQKEIDAGEQEASETEFNAWCKGVMTESTEPRSTL
ncbi:MAG TPA: hypothetical protein VM012_13995 [Flavitalea sp.]|nr:hypothetical protein [Flavitalea sp.]